ncbi:transcriptional regulator, GntR family [Aminomonas paucivorans DSM 12260]|uniref:Transcriptional regulator, GntR family n=1 Tax=Aminomonas paucivorans DSM 12260 TaxID=584708 RepID=E3CVK1_9BACT|nr:GntR family transcriptional regulator [Aminomonas paucivorans]EFQ24192.1 transcriptional regulator, GntR family [Aminomonas paucivorans DSM 12260]
MTEHPLTPATSTDLRQIVYEKIKEAIVNGLIPAGQRLSEVELAGKLDVSRTPVREAIRQLAQTGLVKLVPRKGAFVALPTPKDASDLYEIRTALETLALEHLCARPPREDLIRFRELFGRITNATPPNAYLEEDRRFHSLLSVRSNNNFLETVLHNVTDLIQLCRHYSIEGVSLEQSCGEHIALIDAILDGDLDTAKVRLRVHLGHAREALVVYIRHHPEALDPALQP